MVKGNKLGFYVTRFGSLQKHVKCLWKISIQEDQRPEGALADML